LTIAASEMGDKTQLLAFLLASRFQRFTPIILGIFIATLLNHALAGLIGRWVGLYFGGDVQHILLGLAFLLAAIWVLVPDKLGSTELPTSDHGIFITSFITFFMVEMGDKTQIATILLAAEYQAVISVVLGTTAGIVLVDGLAVFLGQKMSRYVPVKPLRYFAASVFAILAVFELYKIFLA
jgi:Ca2+/H+ antiporter, TMEM165/GDT1 family